jgi:hypothetical protein
VYELSEKTDIIDRILVDLEADKKVIISYNYSPETMEPILMGFKKKIPHLRILHVNQFTRNNTSFKTQEWYDDYDIVAYSPTIAEGVNIWDPRWKDTTLYGMYINLSCTGETVSQKIARFRNVSTIYLHLNIKSVDEPMFNSQKSVIDYYNENISGMIKYSHSHKNWKRQDGGKNLCLIEDEFSFLFSKNIYEHSLDRHNFRETIIQKLIDNDYRYFVYNAEPDILPQEQKMGEKIKEQIKIHQNEILKKISESPNISHGESKDIKQNGCSNLEDKYKMEKYNIQDATCMVDVDIEVVRKFRPSSIQKQVANIKKCMEFRNDGRGYYRRDVSDIVGEMCDANLQQIEESSNFNYQKGKVLSVRPVRLGMLVDIIKSFGFADLLSPEGIDEKEFLENVERETLVYKKNIKEFKKIQRIFKSSVNYGTFMKMDNNFLLNKFKNIFGLVFGVDKGKGLVYQQINIDIKMYDAKQEYPSLLGCFIIQNENFEEYDIMFMKSASKHCDVCEKEFKNGITFRHLNSKAHLSCKLKKEQAERDALVVEEEVEAGVDGVANKVRIIFVENDDEAGADDIVEDNKNHQCELCDFNCVSKFLLDRHIYSDIHRKSFRCIDCNQTSAFACKCSEKHVDIKNQEEDDFDYYAFEGEGDDDCENQMFDDYSANETSDNQITI